MGMRDVAVLLSHKVHKSPVTVGKVYSRGPDWMLAAKAL